jgi:hypothetical protein
LREFLNLINFEDQKWPTSTDWPKPFSLLASPSTKTASATPNTVPGHIRALFDHVIALILVPVLSLVLRFYVEPSPVTPILQLMT